ncbi:MAG: hypothetical protein ACHQ9S_01215 [Candidatus Binatia bacterium]
MRAIEVAGTVNEKRRLQVDAPLPVTGPRRVRVIVLIPEEAEIDENEWLRLAATNPEFDFLKGPEEDVYTPRDGKPFHDER